MANLKEKFSKNNAYEKVKMVVTPSYAALAIVLLLANIVGLIVITSVVSSKIDSELKDLRARVIDFEVGQVEEGEKSAQDAIGIINQRIDRAERSISESLGELAVVFGIIAVVLAGVCTVLLTLNVMKALRLGITNALYTLAFDIKKANEELSELELKPARDTEDEVVFIRSIYFDVVEHLKVSMDDVAKLSGLTERFEDAANMDALTKVYNRRYFFEQVQKYAVIAAKKNELTFVIMLDLDFFKKVNDTYGHAAGDEVLRVIAARVKGTVRPQDLFGRYGGEEFIMFISAHDSESAIGLAERVRIIVQEKPVHFEGTDIPVTSSFGIAQAGPDFTFEDALKYADEALYKAKENGRNRVEIYKPKF
jgi:diguanylate cyclase (GGDEF)-like protein